MQIGLHSKVIHLFTLALWSMYVVGLKDGAGVRIKKEVFNMPPFFAPVSQGSR